MNLDAIFAALADPTRRAILTMLLEDDMAVTDVAEPFAMSLAAISKHLTVLADAGLISQEKRGRVKWCKLEPDAMRAATVWIQGFGQFDPLDFDAFERFPRRRASPARLSLHLFPNTPARSAKPARSARRRARAGALNRIAPKPPRAAPPP